MNPQNIEVMGYISEDAFLKKMSVKVMDFVFYSDKKEANIKLKNSLNSVSADCYAFPHKNKLYFVGSEEKLMEKIEALKRDNNIVKEFSGELMETQLSPLSNNSDMVVARNLVYIGLKHTYRDKFLKVPSDRRTNELRGEFFTGIEDIDWTSGIRILSGLKTKFDYTLDGHGIFWVDMCMGAIKGKNWLSPKIMKELEIYRKFKELSRPPPKKRYEKTIEIIKGIFGNVKTFEIDMKDLGMLKFRKLNLHQIANV